jgi:hypothetical protein
MPSVLPKMSPDAQNMKMRDGTLCTVENESVNEKNMKMGADALGTAENMSGSAKHENV